MRTTATKLVGKRLNWSVQTGVDQTESRTKPVAEDRKHPRFACKTPKQRYSVPKSLIGAQNGGNINQSVFYLGNVGYMCERGHLEAGGGRRAGL